VQAATITGSALTQAEIVRYGLVDTGNMLNTTHPEVVSPLEGAVKVPAHYAIYLHEGHRIVAWGHRTGKFYPPHPFLSNAMKILRPRYFEALKRVIFS
jgi:hypothetical protein